LADVTYDRVVIKPQPGDLVVLYSDGISEATNAAGTELGRDGLLELLRGIDGRSPESAGTQLVSALGIFRGGEPPQDDQTIIVIGKSDS
jgi:sigma-B regulation protein RsbU (phosphoserine phosphatase)